MPFLWGVFIKEEIMIFVTVGSQKFQFDRLLKKVDELVENGEIECPVFAQSGASMYIPKHYQYKAYLDRDEFAQMMEQCDIVITHGGTGAIVSAVKQKKKVIAVPRIAEYGEHVDNHQLQLLKEFEKQNMIYACYDCNELDEAIKNIQTCNYSSLVSNTDKWIKSISDFIESL